MGFMKKQGEADPGAYICAGSHSSSTASLAESSKRTVWPSCAMLYPNFSPQHNGSRARHLSKYILSELFRFCYAVIAASPCAGEVSLFANLDFEIKFVRSQLRLCHVDGLVDFHVYDLWHFPSTIACVSGECAFVVLLSSQSDDDLLQHHPDFETTQMDTCRQCAVMGGGGRWSQTG